MLEDWKIKDTKIVALGIRRYIEKKKHNADYGTQQEHLPQSWKKLHR